MKSEPIHPHGHPVTAAAVVGSFALALVLVLRVSGVFDRAENGLLESYEAGGFRLGDVIGQPWWGLLVVAVAAYGLAWVLFETPGAPRRVLVVVTVVVLSAMGSVVLALWGVFWSPLAVVTGAVWSGFCAMLWARHHPMPCELLEEIAPRKVIRIDETKETPDGKGAGKKREGKRHGA